LTSNGLTVGDDHTIGDDNFDNLVIEASSGENIRLVSNHATLPLDITSNVGLLVQTVLGTDRLFVDSATGDISFYEDTGTTAKLFWDASAESLQIGSSGTATPAANLIINDTAVSGFKAKLTSSAFNVDGNWLGLGMGYYNGYMKSAIIAEAKDGNARANLHFALDSDTGSGNVGLADAKMTVTYDGNVGIGTTSPSAPLDIEHGTVGEGINVSLFSTTQSNGPVLRLAHSLSNTVGTQAAVTVNDVLGKILFAGSDGSSFYDGAAIIADASQTFSGTAGGTRLEFHTTDSGTQTLDQRMVIDQDGSVGIGTSSPDRNLVVNSGASSGYIQLVNTASGTAASNGFELKLDSAGAIVDLINRENGDMRFFTNNQQRMTIDSSGNIGIGVVPDNANLPTVISEYGIYSGNSQANITANTYYNSGWKYEDTNTATRYNQTNGVHYWYTAASGTADTAISWSEAMRIDDSGNVGISNSSPSSQTAGAQNLVVGTSGATGITIASSNNNNGSIFFADGTSGNEGYRGYLQYNHTSDFLAIGTAATEAMRIDSLGRVTLSNAVGASSVFQAENTSNTSGDFAISTLLGANAINTSSYQIICGQSAGSDKFYVYGNGNVVNANNSYGALSDEKLKENIVDSGSQWNDIKALTVRKYSMKEDNLNSPNMLGVIAQEVEAAGMNGLVFESPDRQNEGETIKQVNYSVLYMKAVKALQEAMGRIETLEARITALENA